MDAKTNDIALQQLGAPYEALDEKRQLVARHISERKHIARDMSSQDAAGAGFGQRAADAVARFGGSWTFIGLFAAPLFLWVGANSYVLVRYGVNLKAELEIMLLHEKMDQLRGAEWSRLLATQQEQIRLLERLLAAHQ